MTDDKLQPTINSVECTVSQFESTDPQARGELGKGMLRQIFNIRKRHRLELRDSREHSMPQGYRISLFFRETDRDDQVIAHYRVSTWRHNAAVTRTRAGFEKFSPRGELQDREMRYLETPLH